MKSYEPVKFLGDFINGEFVKSDRPDGSWKKHSPADLKDLILEVESCHAHIGQACQAAKQAYKSWRSTTLQTRAEYLNRLKELYLAHKDEMAELIARETGKPLWEAKTEAQALVAKIDVTLNHSMKHVEPHRIENALPGTDGVVRFKSRGVLAVVGPFNFPAHLPNGHIIPALATGNTVVFKPSDKTPAVGQLMAKIFAEAGFPKGVFNMVQGQGETGKRLVADEAVDGILFTGSYDVGLKIKEETMRHFWKILALEMGGKNVTIVWDDADVKKAVYESIIGCFMSSGQRCSCTSKIVVHPRVRDQFIDNFYQTAKKLTIGHWSTDPFMGPLISDEAVESYIRFQEIAKREGAESLMRGKRLDLDPEGYYVTPSINLVNEFQPKSVYQNHEIFGPNVGIYTTDSFDEAMAITNSAGYGLALAIFAKDEKLYEKALVEARTGLVNWNRTTNGASSKLPFGGMGKSGNDRPSGDFAVYYCTVPVASLEDRTDFDESNIVPGVSFDFK